MSDIDLETNQRVQAILSELLQHRLGKSLEQLDASLSEWRNGDLGIFEAHAEVLKHAARAERAAAAVARADGTSIHALIRDAFDLGIIDRDEFTEHTGRKPEEVEPTTTLSRPLKRDISRQMLEHGAVLVHVDANREGVVVPEHLSNDPMLVLRFGYDLRPLIPDLELGETVLSGTLTFGGVPFHCVLPWPAIYAVISEADQRGMVWPEDVPHPVLKEMTGMNQIPPLGPGPTVIELEPEDAAPAEPAPKKKPERHLKLVD